MQKKRKHGEDEAVNEHQREEVWKLFTNHFLIQPAITAISNKILGKGIKIKRKSIVANLNEDINVLVNRQYYSFVKDAIENIAVQGFFAYNIVPSDARNGKLSFPVVVPWHLYEAKFAYSANYEAEIKCQARMENKTFCSVAVHNVTREVRRITLICKQLKKISKLKILCFVYFNFYSVDNFALNKVLLVLTKGILTSPVASASKYCFILDEAEKYDALAYNILSDPPVLTRHKTDHAFDSRDLLGSSVPGLVAQIENDNMEVRNRININVYKQQQRLIATLNERGIDTANAFWQSCLNPATGKERQSNFSQEHVPKFVPLPSDAEVAQMQLPHARTDMVNFRKQCFEIIATALGVPLNIISSIGGTSVALAQAQSVYTFNTTCRNYANVLSTTLAKVFTQTFTTLKPHEVIVEFPALDENMENMENSINTTHKMQIQ